MNGRTGFYRKVLAELLDDGVLRRDMSVFVSCGGSTDREVLLDLGFENVTISNVDSGGDGNRYAPYAWSWGNAESLDAADGSYDVGLVHAGLHHCHSPHRALLELYRISRVAVVAIEARDSRSMRLAKRVGLTEDYEVSAVASHGLQAGGVENSSTPNYVYRWTEREVEKTIASFSPHVQPRLRFFHALELPVSSVDQERASRRARALQLLRPLANGVARLFPRQANLFGFAIELPRMPDDLQPWMTLVDGEPQPDAEVIGRRFHVGDTAP